MGPSNCSIARALLQVFGSPGRNAVGRCCSRIAVSVHLVGLLALFVVQAVFALYIDLCAFISFSQIYG